MIKSINNLYIYSNHNFVSNELRGFIWGNINGLFYRNSSNVVSETYNLISASGIFGKTINDLFYNNDQLLFV